MLNLISILFDILFVILLFGRSEALIKLNGVSLIIYIFDREFNLLQILLSLRGIVVRHQGWGCQEFLRWGFDWFMFWYPHVERLSTQPPVTISWSPFIRVYPKIPLRGCTTWPMVTRYTNFVETLRVSGHTSWLRSIYTRRKILVKNFNSLLKLQLY